MKFSNSTQKEFNFGSLSYSYFLIKQERKTLSLTVAPDLRVSLKCPHQADQERIDKFLKRKWLWLDKQLSFFKKYQRKIYEREYISGETFYYLGRRYKLLVRESRIDHVSLLKGVLSVKSTKGVENTRYTRRLLDAWFKKQAQAVFSERFHKMKERFDYERMPSLSIREMQKRWGSYLGDKKIILNPKLIHVSNECIDYVIVHELCHLRYKTHSRHFYKFLEFQYPKWKVIKEKLEQTGVKIIL